MEILWLLQNISIFSIIDIALVTALLYAASLLLRRSHAAALVRGMFLALSALLILLFIVANLFSLPALSWLTESFLAIFGVAILIVFQPELRRALELLGSSNFMARRRRAQEDRSLLIDHLCLAALALAERRHGALIVLQRNSSLQAYIQSGISLDSELSVDMLLSIFFPGADLHDGAVIIDQSGRIAAAASVLPLTASRNMPDRRLGTRHRAALGISEVSDCLCIIISEETGTIGFTRAGNLELRLSEQQLRERLQVALPQLRPQGSNILSWLLGGAGNRTKEAAP